MTQQSLKNVTVKKILYVLRKNTGSTLFIPHVILGILSIDISEGVSNHFFKEDQNGLL